MPTITGFTTFNKFQNIPRLVNSQRFTGVKAVEDVLLISGKDGKSGKAKPFAFFSAFVGTLGTMFGVKSSSVEGLTKKELKGVQSDFKDLFMRDDISLEDTSFMVKRYKEIEKIEDKQEYIKAMFNEAKKNYGFGEIDLPLEFERGRVSSVGVTMGGSKALMDKVTISPDVNREQVSNFVHHELRHIKQNYFMASTNKYMYASQVYKSANNIKPMEVEEKDLPLVFSAMIDIIEERWGKLSPLNVPPKYNLFAKKCLVSQGEYVSAHVNKSAYENNFLEVDAYKAGNTIDKVLGLIKSKDVQKS